MKNLILYLMLGGQVKSFGHTLRAMDTDNKGMDDVAGLMCESGGLALEAYAKGDLKGAKGLLKTVADGVYTALGYEPLQESAKTGAGTI